MNYALTMPYGTYTAIYQALSMYLSTLDVLTETSKKIPLTDEEFSKVTMPEGLTKEKFILHTDNLNSRAKRSGSLIEVMRVVLGEAGIFPPGHTLATKDEDDITVNLQRADLRGIHGLMQEASIGLRALVQPKPGADPNNMSVMVLTMLASTPLDILEKHTPLWFQSVLAAKAPIF
jgi:hypothetical protein